jgi:hypothetical protein
VLTFIGRDLLGSSSRWGRSKARGMLDEFSQFLFNQNIIAGWQYQNWMLVIGLPIVIVFVYFSQRSWGAKPAEKSPAKTAN